MTRVCLVCRCSRDYFPTEKRESKASGFKGTACWDCYLMKKNASNATPEGREKSNASNAKRRATPEGREKANAASAKCRATPEGREKSNASSAKRRATPEGRLRHNMSSRLYSALKNIGAGKPANTEELVGCSWSELYYYIDRQLTKDMHWEDYGTLWHIDHRIPCSFAKDVETMKMLFHFTNLTPMWGVDNMSKSAKHSKEEADAFLAKMKET